MNLKDNFALMAQYNQWINEKVYSAAATFSAQELTLNRGAFFGSILGTLNHIMVADTIWLQRFATFSEPLPALNYIRNQAVPASLDQVLHEQFAPLKQQRQKMDQVIIGFINQISEEWLSLPLQYRNTKGEAHKKIFGQLLQHFFNHQTHHRGQATTLFSQTGIDIGITDVLVLIPAIEI
jgi:uncharacterized damage-inducible protein DinB